MSTDKKCLFCINVRTGSLIYGCVLCAVTVIGFILALATMLYSYVMMKFFGHTNKHELWWLAFISTLLFSVPMKFSDKLVTGILTKNPSLVKDYLIYGLVSNIILFIIAGNILQDIHMIRPDDVLAISFILAPFIYALVNYMVYLAYKMMTESQTEGVVADAEQGDCVANKE